jgi:hypothetical protein
MQTLARTIVEKISSANSDSAISTRDQKKEAMKGLADKLREQSFRPSHVSSGRETIHAG